MSSAPQRWLYHLRYESPDTREPYAPASLHTEGFVHCSFRDAVIETAVRYLDRTRPIEVMQIDPRSLGSALKIEPTPRGPMPHVYGMIEPRHVTRIWSLRDFDPAPDEIDSEPTS